MSDSPVPPPSIEERLRAALAPHLLLVRELGAGGMGSVFLARDPALKRTVAVKVLAPDLAADPAARARFEREAQAVAGLAHPNVVPVYSVGELADGTPYFVMQHVNGRSMAARLEEDGPLAPAEVRRVLGEVAGALAAAHAKGIIHRDIKPANILDDEDAGRALVSDFGIAAIVPTGERKSSAKLTQTGMVIGTPQYMSPEQLLSEPVSEKTDIYSLGLLGYELLTGRGPFQATSPHELIAAFLRDTPRKLSELRDDVDPDLDGLIARCLDRDPAGRPTADEVARRLAPGGGVLLEWPPPGLEPLHGRLNAVSRLFWVASVLLLIALMPLLLAGTRVASAMVSTGSMFLLLAGAAGMLSMVAAMRGAVILGRAASRAVHSGYAWLTVLETMSDARGDTGSLIAGTHVFGSLPADRRSALRRARLVRQLALLAGGILPLPLLILVVLAGSMGLVPSVASWVAVALPLACLAAAVAMSVLERGAAGRVRRKPERDRPAPDLARMSAAWYATFETVRQGQALGRGTLARAGLGWAAAAGLAALLIVTIGLVAQLLFIATLGPTVWLAFGKFGDTQRKLQLADVARPFVLPPDSGITPIEAGRALFALDGGRRSERAPWAAEQRVEGVPPEPWNDPLPDSLFRGYHHPSDPGALPKWTVIDSAARGLRPAELAWLEAVAHAPVWRTYRQVARARAVDILGGRFEVPFGSGASPVEMPMLHVAATKILAYANSSRVAYYLARRQRDSAELAAREVISFGFRLIDNGQGLLDVLWGVVVVGIGRNDLETVYRITGNPAGTRLRAQFETVINATEPVDNTSARAIDTSPMAARQQWLATARNPRVARGVRMAGLFALGMSPCTNIQELIFGPREDVRDAFARARTSLARFPSEQSELDMLFAAPERPPSVGHIHAPLPRLLIAMADVSGALLHNRRLSGCVRTLVAFTSP